MKKTNKKKAEDLIKKGDALKNKGAYKKALQKYKKALDFGPDRADLYDRLVAAHEKATEEWEIKDVVDSLSWVMEKQELENPSLKLLHEQLTPEGALVTQKIHQLLLTEDETEEARLTNEIRAFGTAAISPLLFILLELKKGAKKQKENPS